MNLLRIFKGNGKHKDICENDILETEQKAKDLAERAGLARRMAEAQIAVNKSQAEYNKQAERLKDAERDAAR